MPAPSKPSSAELVAERLGAVPLFSHLDGPELARLAGVVRERHYPKNSMVLFADDPGDTLFIVLSGQVKVVLVGEDGREVILSILKDGDFFGEMALIDDRPRSANVIATAACDMLVLRRVDFQRCLEASPRIALGLLRELSRRLRFADDKIGGLVLLDVNGRVARLLLQLADEHDGGEIPRTASHHTLAQMVGSSRETVSRTLRELQEQGLTTVRRDRIALVNRPGLEQLAGLV
jgi:CRP-like cAMP-binding protein